MQDQAKSEDIELLKKQIIHLQEDLKTVEKPGCSGKVIALIGIIP